MLGQVQVFIAAAACIYILVLHYTLDRTKKDLTIAKTHTQALESKLELQNNEISRLRVEVKAKPKTIYRTIQIPKTADNLQETLDFYSAALKQLSDSNRVKND